MGGRGGREGRGKGGGKIRRADAAHTRGVVKLGHGVHNVNYATALLNAANEFCRQAEQLTMQPASQPSR